eukprot:g3834.t1
MCRRLCFGPSTENGVITDWRLAFGRNAGCCSSPCLTILVRFFWMLVMLAIFLWGKWKYIVKDDYGFDQTHLYYFELTHWTLALQTLYHILNFLVAVRANKKRGCCSDGTDPYKIPCLVRLTWCLQAIVLPASFFVFALYWALVFDWEKRNIEVLSVAKHGVNFIVMFFDSLTSGYPTVCAHGIYFILYGIVYLTWSYVHFVLKLPVPYGKEVNPDPEDVYIYEALDWSQPEETGKLAAGIVVVGWPVVLLLFWFISRVRDKCCCAPEGFDIDDGTFGRSRGRDRQRMGNMEHATGGAVQMTSSEVGIAVA